MITITLYKIKANCPCADGWRKVLAANGGTNADMSKPFAVASILESNDLDDTIWALRCLPKHANLWRKYAVWCARQVQHLMLDPRSLNALDVAWRHSDGLATDSELTAARNAARDAAGAAAWDAAGAAAGAAAWAAAWGAAWAAARAAQKEKLIEILTAGHWVD